MIVRTQPIREKIDPVIEIRLRALSAAGGKEFPSTLALISCRAEEKKNISVSCVSGPLSA